jgi:hypothetical protein
MPKPACMKNTKNAIDHPSAQAALSCTGPVPRGRFSLSVKK